MSDIKYLTQDASYESGVLFEEAPLAYGFDMDTREYLRSEPCQLDALETQTQNKAVWLLPAHATLTPPPEAQDGKARVWDGTAWQQVKDHRGTAYWLPSEGDDWQSPARKMAALGPLPEGAVTERPIPPAPTLEEARAAKIMEIGIGYDAAMTATLTMPAEKPSPAEIALATLDFQLEDAEGLAYVRGLLAARRDELLAKVEAATGCDAVAAIAVAYPV